MLEVGGLKSSNTIIEILYKRRLKEFSDRIEELRNPNVVYVTELVTCSHKRFYRLNYPELTLTFEPTLILGELLHYGLEEVLREEGYNVEVEVERDYTVNGGEYKLKGRVDALGRGGVVEIKTGRAGQTLPHQHHILQLQVYMELLDVNWGILVYVTPDRLVEFKVERESVRIEELISDTIKDSTHPRWEWECRYCPYSKLCPYKLEV